MNWIGAGKKIYIYIGAGEKFEIFISEIRGKNKPGMFFLVLVQKKGWEIGPHVANLRSRWFLFQGVQVRP